MKTEQEIQDRIKQLKKDMKKQKKDEKAEHERNHPLSAQAHREFIQMIDGQKYALELVLGKLD